MNSMNKRKILYPYSDHTLSKIATTMHEVCNLLDTLYDINCGGCCYVAWCLSSLLTEDNINYNVEVVSNYEELESCSFFDDLDDAHSHYGISIGGYYINITDCDINDAMYHNSFENVTPDDLKKHYDINYWNSCYDIDKNDFIYNIIKQFYYECTESLRE